MTSPQIRREMTKCHVVAEIVLISAATTRSSHRVPLTEDALLVVLRERGGTASRATLARALDVPVGTVARRLASLIDVGGIERVARGAYRLPREAMLASLPPTAVELVRALVASGAEAHLTGYDLLASHSHQFVRSFPHLVYADSAALEQVAFALSQAGFQPVPAGRRSRFLVLHAPDPDRVVVLRGQPVSRMERLGVRSEVGPPEKAWLDLLRETRTGIFPISLADVGAILSSLLRSGADEALLKRWAREMGYDRHLSAVIQPLAVFHESELRELAAGAAR